MLMQKGESISVGIWLLCLLLLAYETDGKPISRTFHEHCEKLGGAHANICPGGFTRQKDWARR